jgi:hypothetical protein
VLVETRRHFPTQLLDVIMHSRGQATQVSGGRPNRQLCKDFPVAGLQRSDATLHTLES